MEHIEIRSATALANKVLNNSELLAKIKENPELELPRIAEQVVRENPVPAYFDDYWVYRIVVLALGLTVLSVVLGSIILTGTGNHKIPEVLTAIGSASVGALAGLLAPSPGRGK